MHELLFVVLDGQDAVLDRVLHQETVHSDGPRLTEAVNAVDGLLLAGVSRSTYMLLFHQQSISHTWFAAVTALVDLRTVQANAAGAQRHEDEQRPVLRAELGEHLLALLLRRASIEPHKAVVEAP